MHWKYLRQMEKGQICRKKKEESVWWHPVASDEKGRLKVAAALPEKRVSVMGKIVILSFSDNDEHIIEKIKEVIEKENSEQFIEKLQEPLLAFSGLEIHLKEQEVYWRGKGISLSHREYLTLCLLASHPGWVFTKEQIYDAVYDAEKNVDIENVIYCLIGGIRKKLKNGYIWTVRGAGYKFVIPEAKSLWDSSIDV